MKDLAREIKQVDIEKELKRSYLDYAMSVIIGRALPDVRDGLKPVHRRILFAMSILHNEWNKPYKKSARIVGDVIGKYHPHGDSAVYDAIVRMAQSFSLRYPLIDGQGNFGSIDGDSAAAMRYTEIRMSKITHQMLNDLEKKTTNFVLNYDGTEKIPEILPTQFPNLLINGSSGIAVGMATNIPPHNLKEIINGCIAYLKEPCISLKKLMTYIPGPDFPTSGIIYGTRGIKEAYKTGKGKILIRSKHFIEKNKKTKKESLIVHELPYQVNKARLIEKIAILVKEKKINGITGIRDESDKDGMRIVIDIKKDFITNIVLNKLYSLTSLQTSFGINMVALSSGQPKQLSLTDIIKEFLQHRKEIIIRKCLFKLKKFTKKIHILEGFSIALKNIDKIIRIIKISNNNLIARKNLEKIKWTTNISLNDQNNLNTQIIDFHFSKKQALAILDIKLNKLTTLEKSKINQELHRLIKKQITLKKILSHSHKIKKIIEKELLKIKENFSDTRRTAIIKKTSDLHIEDMIIKETVVVTLSHSGYVKYQPISDYNAQKRGGKGKSAAKTKEEDRIENLLVANSLDTILCFSSRGLLYWMKVYQLPEASRNARGKPIINLLPLTQKERITAILPITEYKASINIFMATTLGYVKKIPLNQFQKPRNSGIIAIHLRKNDELISVALTNGNDNILIFTSQGKVVQFSEQKIRKMGRTASGIRGIKIIKNDRLVSLIAPNKLDDILIVTENGYGKRTKINQFPIKSRATKGVLSIRLTPKNGIVVGAIQVHHSHQVMIITDAGTLVRLRVSEIAVLKRNTQGVILIRTTKKEKVVGLQNLSPSLLGS
ncbi:DNA gyrase subunit A [Buchnera aphidicola]|uniref:DNA gyrase subunit A n=1 Tax=Buchnera aphidicola TaxID=9 RepID=UPI00094C66A3|nr:DNA gyrase subunit A [Buchnera aphidicola]